MTTKQKSVIGGGLIATATATVLLLQPDAPMPLPVSFGLEWEHDGGWTSGFVIERSTNLPYWEQVGFVDVEAVHRINADDLTYRWQSTNEPAQFAFYRVGAVPR